MHDFERVDRTDLSEIDARTGSAGAQAFRVINAAAFSSKAGQLKVKDGLVTGGVDGDGRADSSIEVRGVQPTEDHVSL
jgi:hypothetical protein